MIYFEKYYVPSRLTEPEETFPQKLNFKKDSFILFALKALYTKLLVIK